MNIEHTPAQTVISLSVEEYEEIGEALRQLELCGTLTAYEQGAVAALAVLTGHAE